MSCVVRNLVNKIKSMINRPLNLTTQVTVALSLSQPAELGAVRNLRHPAGFWAVVHCPRQPPKCTSSVTVMTKWSPLAHNGLRRFWLR